MWSWLVRIVRTITFRGNAYTDLMHERSATWQSVLTAFLVLAPHQVVEFFAYEGRYVDVLIRGLLSGPIGLVVWTGVVYLFLGSGRQRIGYVPLLRGLGFSAFGLGIAGLANFGLPDASPFKAFAPYLWLLPVAMQVQAVSQMSRASELIVEDLDTPTKAETAPPASPSPIRAAASVLVPMAILLVAGIIFLILAIAMFGVS